MKNIKEAKGILDAYRNAGANESGGEECGSEYCEDDEELCGEDVSEEKASDGRSGGEGDEYERGVFLADADIEDDVEVELLEDSEDNAGEDRAASESGSVYGEVSEDEDGGEYEEGTEDGGGGGDEDVEGTEDGQDVDGFGDGEYDGDGDGDDDDDNDDDDF